MVAEACRPRAIWIVGVPEDEAAPIREAPIAITSIPARVESITIYPLPSPVVTAVVAWIIYACIAFLPNLLPAKASGLIPLVASVPVLISAEVANSTLPGTVSEAFDTQVSSLPEPSDIGILDAVAVAVALAGFSTTRDEALSVARVEADPPQPAASFPDHRR